MKDLLIGYINDIFDDARKDRGPSKNDCIGNVYKDLSRLKVISYSDIKLLKEIHNQTLSSFVSFYYDSEIDNIKNICSRIGKVHDERKISVSYVKKLLREVEFNLNNKVFRGLLPEGHKSEPNITDIRQIEILLKDIKDIFDVINWNMYTGYLENLSLHKDAKFFEFFNDSLGDPASREIVHVPKNIPPKYSMAKKGRESLFFDNFPGISLIVSAESGMVVKANKKALEFYGYTENEIARIPISYIDPGFNDKIAEPVDINGKPVLTKHRLKNGLLRDVEVHVSGIIQEDKLYDLYTVFDITEKKVLENRLLESERLFDAMAENTKSGLAIYNNDNFIYTNSGFREMVGYTREELEGKNLTEIAAEEFREVIYRSIQTGLKRNNYLKDRIIKIVKKNGEEIWVDLWADSIMYKGERARIANIININDLMSFDKSLVGENEKKILDALVRNIKAGVGLYAEDKFLFANKQLLKLLKCTKEKFFAQSPGLFFKSIEDRVVIQRKCSPSLSGLFGGRSSDRLIYKTVNEKAERNGLKSSEIQYISLLTTKINYNDKQTGLAVFTDVTEQVLKARELKAAEEAFGKLSDTKRFMQVYDRRLFGSKLKGFLTIAKTYGMDLSFIIFDVDHFRHINLTYGDEIGNIILKELYVLVEENIKESNFFVRSGDDEFIIINPETSPYENAQTLAEKLRLIIENHDFKTGFPITCSFGTTISRKGDNAMNIIGRMEDSLRNARERGGNVISSN